MTELAVQSAAAFLAIFGFSIILDVPKKFLLYAGAAGGVCWFVYLLALQAGRSLIMAACPLCREPPFTAVSIL